MTRKFSKELIEEIGNAVSPLCAYVDVCEVNKRQGVKLCFGTFKECKSFNMQESFGGYPEILSMSETSNKEVSYSGSSTKAFPDYKEEDSVLTKDKIKDMMDKVGDLMPPSSPFYILTPDDIYAFKNPLLDEFEWREPKEMVMGVDPGAEEGDKQTGIPLDIKIKIKDMFPKNTSSIEESQESMSMTAEARSRYEELDELEDEIKNLGFDDTKDVLRFLNSRKAQRQRKQTKTKEVKREDRQILI